MHGRNEIVVDPRSSGLLAIFKLLRSFQYILNLSHCVFLNILIILEIVIVIIIVLYYFIYTYCYYYVD